MGKKNEDSLAAPEQLQAVVLADSFSKNFRPITLQMPKVLMPLANVPMIEYTLEFLAAGGVKEIFVFCCAHADEIERYVRESRLEKRLATVKLHVVASKAPCFSSGTRGRWDIGERGRAERGAE
jgi:translation initiation factor eIF-2B subunit epsilon